MMRKGEEENQSGIKMYSIQKMKGEKMEISIKSFFFF